MEHSFEKNRCPTLLICTLFSNLSWCKSAYSSNLPGAIQYTVATVVWQGIEAILSSKKQRRPLPSLLHESSFYMGEEWMNSRYSVIICPALSIAHFFLLFCCWEGCTLGHGTMEGGVVQVHVWDASQLRYCRAKPGTTLSAIIIIYCILES